MEAPAGILGRVIPWTRDLPLTRPARGRPHTGLRPWALRPDWATGARLPY